MKYMVITTRGFEDIAEQDILNKLSDVEIIEKSYRKIIFSYNNSIESILQIRSVEDAFLFIGKLTSIGHTRNDLPDLVSKISSLDFLSAKDIIQTLRTKPLENFSISSSSVGKRNYSYIEVKDHLHSILESKTNLKYENELHQQFDIRIFLEHDVAYVGVRLAEAPLHRRAYKLSTTKATLRADIAYNMCLLADISGKDTVLDPMCGSGTILIEAAVFKPKSLLGGDINSEAVTATESNSKAFDPNLKIDLQVWDAHTLPLQDNSVDKIICNLPFGKQIEVENIEEFYKAIFQEFNRVLKPKGKIVILTSYDKITELLNLFSVVRVNEIYETNINGEVAQLLVLDKK
jgi:tRNA (guanine6-N2)-methyltransferase